MRTARGPGLILAIVGGSAGLAAVLVVCRSAAGASGSLAAGLILIKWIGGEVVLIRADNELVSPTELIYLLLGLATIALAVPP